MEPLAVTYIVASLVVYLIALLAAIDYQRCAELAWCGLLLLLYCIGGNILWASLPEPDSYRLDPALDLAAVVIVGVLHWRRPAWWKAALALCFLTQLGLEAWFWTAKVGWAPELPLRLYEPLINALFVGQLLCVALPGGGHVAGRVLAWLSHRRGGRSVALPQPRREG